MLNALELHLPTDDGVRLSLWKLQDGAKHPPAGTRDIFLTHGTFSDRRICLGIATYFASLGYTCWTLEWRGHGSSGASPVAYDFETVARHDVKAALEHLIREEGIQGLHGVTHSGGGIVLTMCLARNPQLVPVVDKLALFACQALHAASSTPREWLLRSMRLASRLWSSVPGAHLGLGVQDESFFMMKQWYDWNISQSFSGRDGFDYWAGMRRLTMPVLPIAGTSSSHRRRPARSSLRDLVAAATSRWCAGFPPASARTTLTPASSCRGRP